MTKLTAANLANAINQLPKDRVYNYINPSTKTLVKIVRVQLPEGPIIIKRWNPTRGQTESNAKELSISPEMLWRIATAFQPNYPINFDRILGGSYNTRSALEALLAHTPQFYGTQLKRLEIVNGESGVKNGHKHLIWMPEEPHENGILGRKKLNLVISEVPGSEIVYDAISALPASPDIDIETQRRHAQIQIALMEIGKHLGYTIYVAKNDQGIIYKDKRLVEHEGVIASPGDNTLISPWADVVREARLIDVVWFKNSKLMPAVMEIEHTTGVTSGLTRMKKFKEVLPPFPTRYVIVAADEDRQKVISEANIPLFKDLEARYFPYSAVEELYSLCKHRNLRGVSEEFLDCYMEPVVGSDRLNQS